MERLLGTVDAAIYLLDYTKLKTVEEATLFAKLKVAPHPGLGEGLQANMHTPYPCLCKALCCSHAFQFAVSSLHKLPA